MTARTGSRNSFPYARSYHPGLSSEQQKSHQPPSSWALQCLPRHITKLATAAIWPLLHLGPETAPAQPPPHSTFHTLYFLRLLRHTTLSLEVASSPGKSSSLEQCPLPAPFTSLPPVQPTGLKHHLLRETARPAPDHRGFAEGSGNACDPALPVTPPPPRGGLGVR